MYLGMTTSEGVLLGAFGMLLRTTDTALVGAVDGTYR